jgi:hypothetical protein
MRYYLGQLEYKWSHVQTDMEQLWVRRELGDELFKTVEANGWCWVLMRSNSMTLPGDIYCRTLVYVDTDNDKLDTHFMLKFPQACIVEPLK